MKKVSAETCRCCGELSLISHPLSCFLSVTSDLSQSTVSLATYLIGDRTDTRLKPRGASRCGHLSTLIINHQYRAAPVDLVRVTRLNCLNEKVDNPKPLPTFGLGLHVTIYTIGSLTLSVSQCSSIQNQLSDADKQ